MRLLLIPLLIVGLAGSALAFSGQGCVTIVKYFDSNKNAMTDEAKITLAASRSGIIARTRNSVSLAPGYRYKVVNRGGRKIMQVTSPDVSGGPGGSFECECSNHHGGGVCFPAMNGKNGVICKSHKNGCFGSCVMNVIMAPPPPP